MKKKRNYNDYGTQITKPICFSAAAILQLALGRSFRWIALHGCLKERDPETIAAWYRAYCAGGIQGLQQLKRRSDPLTAEQQEQLLETILKEPEAFSIPRSRWLFMDLKQVLPFLSGYTLSGIWLSFCATGFASNVDKGM